MNKQPKHAPEEKWVDCPDECGAVVSPPKFDQQLVQFHCDGCEYTHRVVNGERPPAATN